jgi:hypothetical protein
MGKPSKRCTTTVAAAGFVYLRHVSLGRGMTLRRSHRIHPSPGYASDQTCAALEESRNSTPSSGDRQAVAKADEEVDVGHSMQLLWSPTNLRPSKSRKYVPPPVLNFCAILLRSAT